MKLTQEERKAAREEGRKPTPVAPDRVIALAAMMEAKGNALPKPPVCHGYANCCRCPACELRARRHHTERLAA